MASIRDVAKKAGLSVATVSSVINGTRRARAATEERMRSAVRELGYSINQAARDLAAGRSSFLGLIISDVRNPFSPEITSVFQDQELVHEMEPIVLNTNCDIQRTLHCVKRMVSWQVPGVTILSANRAFRDGSMGSQRNRGGLPGSRAGGPVHQQYFDRLLTRHRGGTGPHYASRPPPGCLHRRRALSARRPPPQASFR